MSDIAVAPLDLDTLKQKVLTLVVLAFIFPFASITHSAWEQMCASEYQPFMDVTVIP